MARKWRRRWIILLVPVTLVLAATFGLRYVLQPERLTSFLLREVEAATGLEIRLQEPADLGWWPDLHIELEGLSVHQPGQGMAILKVAQVDLALPWSSLRQDADLRLSRLRLIGPQLDIPSVLGLIESRADSGPPAPLILPRLDTPLQVREGRILGVGWALENLRLDLPFLHPDQPTRLDASAALVANAQKHLFALQLATTPAHDGDALLFQPLELNLAADELMPWRPQLVGHLRWYPNSLVELDLQTRIEPWPDAWPELPPTTAQTPTALHVSMQYAGDTSLQGRLTYALARGEDQAHGELRPDQLLDWLGHEQPSSLPPLEATVDIPRLEYQGIEASGVRLRLQTNDRDNDN